jgi:hypothetical protein
MMNESALVQLVILMGNIAWIAVAYWVVVHAIEKACTEAGLPDNEIRALRRRLYLMWWMLAVAMIAAGALNAVRFVHALDR